MTATHSLPLRIQPVIAYPSKALLGSTYLMTIDLRWSMEDLTQRLAPQAELAADSQGYPTEDQAYGWPYAEEEYEVYCMVETSPGLKVRTIDEPAIVLHRFGGTYGPAQFLLSATTMEHEPSLRVTLVNQWGLPIQIIKLDTIQIVETLVEQQELVIVPEPAPPPAQTQRPQRKPPRISVSTEMADLIVRLTPPSDPQPFIIADVHISFDGASSGPLPLVDPLFPQEYAELNWYLNEYWQWPSEEFAQRGTHTEELLAEVGQRLYQVIFGNDDALRIVQAWRLQPNVNHQISIMSDLPAALSLPWELLHDDQGFLALRARNPVTILRRLPQRKLGAFASKFTPPLRILLVTARPENTGFIDPRVIAHELLDELSDQIEAGAVALEFLRPPTLATLAERLGDTKRSPIHILHFDGHGSFEQGLALTDALQFNSSARGVLAFEDSDNNLDLVEAEALAQVLQYSDVQLAILTSCQSAMSNADDVFSSVAARLIRSGVHAVVAMSHSVLVVTAARYVETFYRELANGMPVVVAHQLACKALYTDRRRHMFQRKYDAAAEPISLQDWWVPRFYQERPLTLAPQAPRRRKQENAALPRLSEMPPQPRHGFTGRARELLKIERLLLHKKLVVIHGFGGYGKTALARESADWLTRTKLYQRALFVSFEQGGGATVLLSALINHLNVPGSYNPADVADTLKKLKPVLKKQPTLIIADNLESILPDGEAPLDPAERSKLWDVLHQLRQLNVGVLLTTNLLNFGHDTMAEGQTVAYLSLRGLRADDAHTFATNILTDLAIDRQRVPYAELRDLLVQLDHQPLAIQLVLPALKEQSITRIRNDFAALLATFMDENETGHNRSLLASLEYSLRRLSDEQRALLPRLALFEGGALATEILAITEITETEWAMFRVALEQAGLLTEEFVHEAIAVPFFRFHPIFGFFLRTQSGADDEVLKQRYAQRYHVLANDLYHQDSRNPQPVRWLVRRELPNLRHALSLLIEIRELDAAVAMFDSLAMFLNVFGMWRESDELRMQLGAAFTAQLRGSNELTWTEYLRESTTGEIEFVTGNLQREHDRFTWLMHRMNDWGTDAARSYDRCVIIHRLARCHHAAGHADAARQRLHEALAMIGDLITFEPEHQSYYRQRSMLLTSLSDVLVTQGRYDEAHTTYDTALAIAQQSGDLRQQGVVLGQHGMLAVVQRSYADAESLYRNPLRMFQELAEPASESVVWHQLGIVAQEQSAWATAEQYYGRSIELEERIGGLPRPGLAATYNQLGMVAEHAGRRTEAERWYLRSLENSRQHGNEQQLAIPLNNFANLLLHALEIGHVHPAEGRLTEALRYAEQAMQLKETLDLSAEPWLTLSILARIAEIEGRFEEARAYRRRERETFAAFEGNRYHIDRQFGNFITLVVTAFKRNQQIPGNVESLLSEIESIDWHISNAIQRIWYGEREWHTLVEDIDRSSALLVLRILETIEHPEGISHFALLLQSIVIVAQGDQTQRIEIEATLAVLETMGWQLTQPVQRIWSGERDGDVLCEGLDQQDAALVRRILEILVSSPSSPPAASAEVRPTDTLVGPDGPREQQITRNSSEKGTQTFAAFDLQWVESISTGSQSLYTRASNQLRSSQVAMRHLEPLIKSQDRRITQPELIYLDSPLPLAFTYREKPL